MRLKRRPTDKKDVAIRMFDGSAQTMRNVARNRSDEMARGGKGGFKFCCPSLANSKRSNFQNHFPELSHQLKRCCCKSPIGKRRSNAGKNAASYCKSSSKADLCADCGSASNQDRSHRC